MNTKTSTTALYNANGMQLSVGDVVRYGGKPHYIEFIGQTFVTIVTMDERKITHNVKPAQINCVVQKEEE